MSKNPPLLPSLRERKRYLAFEVLSSKRVGDFPAVSRAILNSCHTFLGDTELAKAGIQVLPERYDGQKQKGILLVKHRYTDQARGALVFVTEIDEEPVIVRSLGMSGMLQKAHQRYIAA